ncbi:IS110 family transposase [Paenibacillus sp. SZ31]|uniref:IS110 family transposase n=1 Tax=Paenibacillus sp. SZ31 TaxID=2725555 RepID=UPI00146EFBA0|nr:IS110 family transposase [Paenibacillus sp. SZ31]NMI07918.1 IS110 family transposase [Paenibacillus sp. SZ31]
MKSVTKYVGLDVSKEKIAVAVANEGREPAYFIGMFPHTEKAVRKFIQTLTQDGSSLEICYEAGPTGYALYRLLTQMGISCSVIAPSLIPSRPGDRVKTDRRDALKLAQLLRSGELQAVYVPTEADEALRDLVRAREDSKENLLRAKHRLTKFLLRHSIPGPEGVRRWSVKYWSWLKVLRLPNAVQQTVLQEYIHTIQEEMLRLGRLEKYMAQEAQSGPRASLITALQVLRGVALITAITLVAEVGSFLRFPKGSSFMSYTGLVPSEYSTGQTTRRGATTKAGNRHVRRAAVEAAWSYRYQPALKGKLLQRQQGQNAEVCAMAWHAQVRLHEKYRKLLSRGMNKNKVITAIARELSGFVWAIASQIETQQRVANQTT